MVAIASERRNAIDFFRKIGIVKNRVGNAILAGGGKVSYYLAKSLLASGIRVTIIEVDRERCDILSELLPHATVICGDATDQNLLLQEGLEHAQGFAALTGLDEENILLSLYANDISNAKTVTKINRINFHSVINELNLGSIIYPRIITSDYILKYASRGFGIYYQSRLRRCRNSTRRSAFPKKYSDLLYLPQWQSYYPEWSGYHDGR